jgi:hypothetical protein
MVLTCTVGGVEVSELGAVARLYDYYYLGNGFTNSGDVPIGEDEGWYPIEMTFFPTSRATTARSPCSTTSPA